VVADIMADGVLWLCLSALLRLVVVCQAGLSGVEVGLWFEAEV
jgi:hypothetical protein